LIGGVVCLRNEFGVGFSGILGVGFRVEFGFGFSGILGIGFSGTLGVGFRVKFGFLVGLVICFVGLHWLSQ
jgi:hypothetical protein